MQILTGGFKKEVRRVVEYENNQQPGLWQRLKDSPRTVSALIIILVIAAAIYAFSGPQQSPGLTSDDGSTDSASGEEQQTSAPSQTMAPRASVVTPAPVSQEELEESREALPSAEETDEGYKETAKPGNGATHLARRAATRYLAEHSPSYAVTNEHRIYIEDYIQKKMGSPRLEIGQTQTISFALIEEAVKSAGELTPAQLNNLSQYTHVLQ